MMGRLCSWTDHGDDWSLRLSLPADADIAEANAPSLRSDQDLFAALNGITDRRRVPEGVMAFEQTDSGPAHIVDLRVPRGFRGSLTFMPVPRGIETADRDTWLAAYRNAFLPVGTGLRTVADLFGRPVFEVSAPDAKPLIWTAEAAPDAEAADGTSGGDGRPPHLGERIDVLDGTARRVLTYQPKRASASAPVLVVFDGKAFVDGGLLTTIDELVGPPSLVIAVDHAPIDTAADSGADRGEAFALRASDLVMNPRFCDEVLTLVASLAPNARDRTIVAGASYGGLAATYFALRHPEACRAISLSPSFWASDSEGRRIWEHFRAGTSPEFLIHHGALESEIARSVAEARAEFTRRGLSPRCDTFSGGHEYLWWRELLPGHLAELLAENRDMSTL